MDYIERYAWDCKLNDGLGGEVILKGTWEEVKMQEIVLKEEFNYLMMKLQAERINFGV